MTLNVRFLYLAVMTAFFISCTASKKTVQSQEPDLRDMQHVFLDTMTVRPDKEDFKEDLPAYKPSKERIWDLLHTALDLSFDWPKEAVIGKATLTLTPIFYTQTSLRLDAVNFEIHHLSVDDLQVKDYFNTDEEIIIPLTKPYKKDDLIKVEIEYTAHPRPSRPKEGAAISSDQGLFFIDPQDTIPGLPMQIWTQGETTHNRRWFPTLDQPNERCTQEIILTVADTLMTLSNGILFSSTPLAGGIRRDHWKLDLPHAPYLAMVAVGQWDKVTDYWRGRPVEYYVDLGYGPSAKAIFAHTTEMMDFFSRLLDYDFVWPKYAQVIVKNFVSGAMENTTAVVFGDFIQFHEEEMIEDGTNDYIIAHELFHHWFGNLVTCESWANLTLNEGFANYAEYLWQEYKYGRERADISRLQELSGYFDQAEYTTHPLIHFHYTEEGEMFDAHSYNKGGLVLHMLRDVVGDEAFFAALKLYLQRHAYSAAEVADLRQAFEELTGRDLNWFFDQWYLAEGHPILDIYQTYDEQQKTLTLSFQQTQGDKGFPKVFILPVEVAIYDQDSSVVIHNIMLDQISQTFTIDLQEPPLAVVVDPRDILLAVINHDIPESEYAFRSIADLAINHRISAFRVMDNPGPDVINRLVQDSSYTMRAMLINLFAQQQDADRLVELSARESHPELQFYLLQSLHDTDARKAKDVAIRILETAQKPQVIYAALMTIASVDVDEAIHQLAHFENNPSQAVYVAQAYIYARKGKAVSLDFYMTERAAQVRDQYLEEFIGAMALYLSGQSYAIQDKGLALMDSDFFLQTDDPQYRRFYLITGLLRQFVEEEDEMFQEKILSTIKSIYSKETSDYLRGVLEDGLGELLD